MLAIPLVLAALSADPEIDAPAPTPAPVSLGAVLTNGYHRYGYEGDAEVTLRFHGVVVGGTASYLSGGRADYASRTELLGIVGGYAVRLGAYRVEALGSWGRSFVTTTSSFYGSGGSSSSHFFGGELGVDRFVARSGAVGWTVGLGAWWRRLSMFADYGGNGYAEFGGGVRLGVDWSM